MEGAFYLRFNQEEHSNYIGHLEKGGYIVISIFSFLSILMNMIFIINYIIKKMVNKKQKKYIL